MEPRSPSRALGPLAALVIFNVVLSNAYQDSLYLSLHVRDLPLFDYREALRPSTRLGPPGEEEFEEEG